MSGDSSNNNIKYYNRGFDEETIDKMETIFDQLKNYRGVFDQNASEFFNYFADLLIRRTESIDFFAMDGSYKYRAMYRPARYAVRIGKIKGGYTKTALIKLRVEYLLVFVSHFPLSNQHRVLNPSVYEEFNNGVCRLDCDVNRITGIRTTKTIGNLLQLSDVMSLEIMSYPDVKWCICSVCASNGNRDSQGNPVARCLSIQYKTSPILIADLVGIKYK